jgi:4-hydroxy-tetrahydrodipicolinate synthase
MVLYKKKEVTFITAVGTPLDSEGKLEEESFRLHLNDQIKNGIDSILVMGSMGMMPCLTLPTYLRCDRTAVSEAGRKMKVMVGVGCNSIQQTMERTELLKNLKIDAVVVTTPYYFVCSQKDLIYYFTEIANRSPFPLYLYDLPQITKVKIELETVLRLSEHDNIHGIKCSHDPVYVKALFDKLSVNKFEIISALYDLIDMFIIYGIKLHLDGFFSIIPYWLKQIKDAYLEEDFERIIRLQKKMTWLRKEFIKIGVFPAFTEAMNLLGFNGRFHPSHYASFDESGKASVKKLLAEAGLI